MTTENNPPESQPLKPCPFCGKKPNIDDDGLGVQYSIFCDNQECVISSNYRGEQKAIEAWNRRATSEELAAVKKQLADRDMDWWETLCSVDGIAPNPASVKQWVLLENEYRERCLRDELAAVKAERDRMRDALSNVMQYLHDTDELGEEYLTPKAKECYEKARAALSQSTTDESEKATAKESLTVQPVTEESLARAVNEECSCGGKSPYDNGACPACMVWHRLITLPRMAAEKAGGA